MYIDKVSTIAINDDIIKEKNVKKQLDKNFCEKKNR